MIIRTCWCASNSNHKLEMFFSRYWIVNCFGIDAFTGIWSDINGWFCPSIYFIARMLAKFKEDIAFGCLIIPMWNSANFWPIFCPDGEKICDFVKNVVYLTRPNNFL